MVPIGHTDNTIMGNDHPRLPGVAIGRHSKVDFGDMMMSELIENFFEWV